MRSAFLSDIFLVVVGINNFTYFLRTGIVSLTFVLLMFFYFIFFSRATVSAVLQPCRTCHMLFVVLARCVVCVLGK